MNKGTLADKIAAHVVAIQDNPVFNLETLRNLLGMVKVAKKKECVSVMGMTFIPCYASLHINPYCFRIID